MKMNTLEFKLKQTHTQKGREIEFNTKAHHKFYYKTMITFKVRWAKLCYIQHTLLNFFLRKVNECPKSIYLETIFKMLEFFYNFFIFLIKVILKLS